MRKTEVESWEELMAEEVAKWDADVADEALFDDPGADENFEELHCGERELDRHRWELDPASAEDYGDRSRAVRIGPSLRWRHFGH